MSGKAVLKKKDLVAAIIHMNAIVEKHGHGSALQGLRVVAAAFTALMDIYAAPNPENPKGMCDDPMKLRRLFCDEIMGSPDGSCFYDEMPKAKARVKR